jgi:hypothetical protein
MESLRAILQVLAVAERERRDEILFVLGVKLNEKEKGEKGACCSFMRETERFERKGGKRRRCA